jgi:hypothetical protein
MVVHQVQLLQVIYVSDGIVVSDRRKVTMKHL